MADSRSTAIVMIAIVFLSFVAISCSTSIGTSEAIPASGTFQDTDLTATPTVPKPTRTATPKATDRASASDTPVPEQIPTGTPDVSSLSTDGPWVVFTDNSGLWAVNTDGTGLVQIIEFPSYLIYGFSYSVSPSGGKIAFNGPVEEYFGSEPFSPDLQSSPNLYLVNLPATDLQQVTNLIAPSQIEMIATKYPSPNETSFEDSSFFRIEQIKAAIARQNSLAWSPSGDKLAFSAALDGPTTDLYVFDSDTENILRLSSGLTQAVDLEWSQDGQYIIHKAVSDINIGRSGPMLIIEGLWAAAKDGTDLNLLMQGDLDVMGWVSDFQILLHKWDWECWRYSLTAVDIRTAGSKVVWRGPFEYADADMKSGTILVGHGYNEARSESFPDSICPFVYSSGLYRLSGTEGEPERVGNWEPLNEYEAFKWSSDLEAFVVLEDGEVRYLSPSGEVSIPELQFATIPIMSPSGSYFAQNLGGSIRIYSELQEDISIQGSFCNVLWGGDDRTLILTTDEYLYVAKSPDFKYSAVPMAFSQLCESELYIAQP